MDGSYIKYNTNNSLQLKIDNIQTLVKCIQNLFNMARKYTFEIKPHSRYYYKMNCKSESSNFSRSEEIGCGIQVNEYVASDDKFIKKS